MSFLLEVSGLEKSFGGVKAVNSVSFEVKEKTIFSVIGPNGAGKTTLFNLLTGIDRPDSGSITFHGNQLVGMPPYKIASQGISRTFQNLQIFFNMSVIENVMVGCHRLGKASMISAILRLPSTLGEEKAMEERAIEALEFCGMSRFKNLASDSLPYGQLKKLEIARALASDPDLILLDEPAAGLNDTETVELAQLIMKIVDRGVTVLLVEHNMGLVMDVSDRVLVLNYGEVLANGIPSEIQKDKRVIAAYLGEE